MLVVGDLYAQLAQQAELNRRTYGDAGILHDVHDRVLGCDIPTPYKRMLGAVAYQIEDGGDGEVARVFGVDYDVLRSDIVRGADREACYAEVLIFGADVIKRERRRWVPKDFVPSLRARSLVEIYMAGGRNWARGLLLSHLERIHIAHRSTTDAA